MLTHGGAGDESIPPREVLLHRRHNAVVFSAGFDAVRFCSRLMPALANGSTRTVDVHIRRLRMTLGAAGRQSQTVPDVGYRFSED